jgi:hypothetical protein
MLLNDSMWPDLCLTILKSACIEAAESWLGYVPSELRKAVAEKSDPIDSEQTIEPSTVIEWFAIQERMPIYCSIIRLLRSSQVQHQHSTPQSQSIQGWQATLNDQSSSLLRFAPHVLHDMTIRTADLVASAYLQEATNATWGVDPSPTKQFSKTSPNDTKNKALAIPEAFFSLEPSWWASFAHPRLLSTRQLQRFLNRISLFRWLYSNVTSVSAVLEDRLPLLILSRAKTGPALLRVFNLPMRRSKELSNLNGLRYAVSLAMEAMDILAPLTVMLWTKARQVVVWVLVQGLGKGVGLFWRGIREGLNAKNVSARHRAPKRTKPI